jgi:hypothetical protein
MEDIIAGRFETEDEARLAAASLTDLVSENDIFIFFNNQPGAHDADSKPADQGVAESAAKGAATGAVSGGIAAGVVGTMVGGLLRVQLRLLWVDIPAHSRAQQEVCRKKARAPIKLPIRGWPE